MSDKAAATSLMPMVIAAVEQRRPEENRLLTDDLAIQVLPTPLRSMMRWRVVRRLLITMMDKQAPGIWNSLACRKRYLDDKVADAIRDGIDALVVLGAGLDTRAARLAAPAGIASFEVDLPVNITRKRQRIRIPASVTMVPIDFEQQEPAVALAGHGHGADRVTMFVWEGVTQYLTEAAVRAVFELLANAATGSKLAFTYVRKDFLDGINFYDSEPTYRRFVVKDRIWRFGLHPDEVPALLAEYGWRELEQVGPEEYLDRYLAPAGRGSVVSGLERCVYAEKIRATH